MKLYIGENEFKLFRSFVERECGILISENKKYLIENRLARLVTQTSSRSFSEFHRKILDSSPRSKLRTQMIDAITTNETYWFRDQYPFTLLEDYILPQYREELIDKSRRDVKIWSAACSTGQEAHSIAMTIYRFLEKEKSATVNEKKFSILGTDISKSSIEKANSGNYGLYDIERGLSEKYLRLFFIKRGDRWQVDNRIKQMTQFIELNLKKPFLQTIGPFDLIFLRHVLIYFSDEFKKKLYQQIGRILNSGGYLILGSGEIIGEFSDAFELLSHDRISFYRKKSLTGYLMR